METTTRSSSSVHSANREHGASSEVQVISRQLYAILVMKLEEGRSELSSWLVKEVVSKLGVSSWSLGVRRYDGTYGLSEKPNSIYWSGADVRSSVSPNVGFLVCQRRQGEIQGKSVASLAQAISCSNVRGVFRSRVYVVLSCPSVYDPVCSYPTFFTWHVRAMEHRYQLPLRILVLQEALFLTSNEHGAAPARWRR